MDNINAKKQIPGGFFAFVFRIFTVILGLFLMQGYVGKGFDYICIYDILEQETERNIFKTAIGICIKEEQPHEKTKHTIYDNLPAVCLGGKYGAGG